VSDSSLYVRNWRDVQPDISHLNAVHWGGLRDVDRDPSDDERHHLERLGGFARHALQGRKTSDHHKHDDQEQVYYVLSGSGEVLCDGERCPVEAGDAVYLPSGDHHQMFNEDSDGWLEYHVISQAVDGDGGTFRVRNWREAAPTGDGGGGIRWRQLCRTGEGGDGAVLRGLHHIDHFAVQPRSESAEHVEGDLEQVWYVLDGQGRLDVGGEERPVTEGDMIHLPPETAHRLHNETEDWLSALVMAA
jgi:mannose-6-phosphate isomerase-like protein (cupin superfamily)